MEQEAAASEHGKPNSADIMYAAAGAQYWRCGAKYLPKAAASSPYCPCHALGERRNKKPQLLNMGRSSDDDGYEHADGSLFIMVHGR